MSLHLHEIVPWGRSFDEYAGMFSLTEDDLSARILGCGDGPASFNAEMAARGKPVLSVDPIYSVRAELIERRVNEVCGPMVEYCTANRDRFVWTAIPSPRHLGEIRLAAMRRFLADLPRGACEGRYLASALPDLALAGDSFDLALVSHLMFLYSRQLGLDWHIAAAKELCRVVREVRIFPLLDHDGSPSPHVEPVRAALADLGFESEIVPVPYEFLRGASKMLRVCRPIT